MVRAITIGTVVGALALGALSGPGDAASPSTSSTSKAKASTPAPAKGAGEDVAVIKTSMGTIVFRFFDKDAPRHVANFKKLANAHFYDGTTFHRVIPGFMIQGGDPNSKDA